MKKWFCGLLIAALLCAGLAMAEGTLFFTSGDTEAELEAMLPVLDSLAVSMNVGSADPAFQVTYSTDDSHLIWNQLWRLCSDWLSHDAAYRDGDVLLVPASVMEACAKAAFGTRWNPLPAIPNVSAGGTVVYDPAADAYRVSVGADDGHYSVVESYAADGSALLVNSGLYDTTDQRVGGLTARLEPAADGALYPYAVMEAHAESEGDFTGLWVTLCSIRAEKTEAADDLFDFSPAPTPVVVEAEYRTLSAGSRGEDVRALQSRLNELGYNCGSADGVFGSGTRRGVRYFQDAIHWSSQDGTATPELQRRLFADDAPEYSRYVTLSKGSKGIRVESLQDRLRELGYTAAPVDGSYGERLAEAVKLFQRRAGLTADGIAGSATLKALDKSGAPRCHSYIELQKGDSGRRVTELQQRLNELGYLDRKASGKYDSHTVDAVAAFKSDYGLKGNGKSISASAVELLFDDIEPVTPDDDEDIIDDDEDDYVDDDGDDYVDDDGDDYVDDGGDDFVDDNGDDYVDDDGDDYVHDDGDDYVDDDYGDDYVEDEDDYVDEG